MCCRCCCQLLCCSCDDDEKQFVCLIMYTPMATFALSGVILLTLAKRGRSFMLAANRSCCLLLIFIAMSTTNPLVCFAVNPSVARFSNASSSLFTAFATLTAFFSWRGLLFGWFSRDRSTRVPSPRATTMASAREMAIKAHFNPHPGISSVSFAIDEAVQRGRLRMPLTHVQHIMCVHPPFFVAFIVINLLRLHGPKQALPWDSMFGFDC